LTDKLKFNVVVDTELIHDLKMRSQKSSYIPSPNKSTKEPYIHNRRLYKKLKAPLQWACNYNHKHYITLHNPYTTLTSTMIMTIISKCL